MFKILNVIKSKFSPSSTSNTCIPSNKYPPTEDLIDAVLGALGSLLLVFEYLNSTQDAVSLENLTNHKTFEFFDLEA